MEVLKITKAALYFFSLWLLFSCQKNIDQIAPNNPIVVSGPTVQANFKGRIVHIGQPPLGGAVVTIGNQSAVSNIDGYFEITGAMVPQSAALVKVVKNGYFDGYKTLRVQGGATHYVTVALLPKLNVASLSAATGGDVTIDYSSSIHFPAGSMVVAATGAGYTGAAKVKHWFLNPGFENFNSYMPGSLLGIDSSGNEQLLYSHGIIIAELEGSNGEKLQLAPGQMATIRMSIVGGLLPAAPATIPMWYFDDTSGMWKQEGYATKQGSHYVGKVKHLAYWNFDVPLPFVQYKATFKNQAGNQLYMAKVSFKRSNGYLRWYHTDANGQLLAFIPANESLIMTVSDSCERQLLTTNIGPFGNDVNAGLITTANSSSNRFTVNITGSAVNCAGMPVPIGHVELRANSRVSRAAITAGGNFNLQTEICDSSTSTSFIAVYDSTTGYFSTPLNIPITGNTTVNVGQLTSCLNNPDGHVNLFMNGVLSKWSAPRDTAYSHRSFDAATVTYTTAAIASFQPMNANSPRLSLTFNGPSTPAPGNYTLTTFQYLPNGTASPSTGYSLSLVGSSPQVLITEYGPVGGYIMGQLNANVVLSGSSVPIPMYCTFRFRRIT